MNLNKSQRYTWLGGFIFLGGALFLLMGGCPIDGDLLTTEVVDAALQSITSSLVDALSTYLAGN